MNMALKRIRRRVTTSMNNQLSQPYKAEEVRKALKEMHHFKSPGPDGLNSLSNQNKSITGLGIALRDQDGIVRHTFVKHFRHEYQVDIEALACREALNFAEASNIQSGSNRVDCMVLVNRLRRKVADLSHWEVPPLVHISRFNRNSLEGPVLSSRKLVSTQIWNDDYKKKKMSGYGLGQCRSPTCHSIFLWVSWLIVPFLMYMRSIKEGLKLQAHTIKSGVLPAIVTTNQLINLYSKHGLIEDAHKLFDGMSERNVFSWNTIINSYIKSRNFSKAKSLFDSSPCKDSVTYNSMISGYARSDGYESEAIDLFIQMQFDNGSARVDEFTLTTMLNLVAKLRVLHCGRQVHSFMVKSGNDLSVFALSSLIDMYSKCGSFSDACGVVNGSVGEGVVDLVVKNALIAACCREGELEMARKIFLNNPEFNDNVSWNTLISGYAQNGCEVEAVELFKRMAEEGFRWNEHTFASLLTTCSGLKSLKLGKEVHARVLKEGMCLNPFISSGIVDIYCKCGNMRYAESVHETFGTNNVFAITSMIVGYSAKGDMSEARRLFDTLAEKNFVVWTAIISGYVKLQQCEDAFVLFREYVASEDTTVPDTVILVTLLGACAIRASVDPGKQIHAYILRMGIKTDEKAISALIDMYSKCGFILYAQRMFRTVSIRDTVMYNVMIAGCAHHGYEYEAIRHFEEMIEHGLKPDSVTFIALLSACRHCGLVEAGENYFFLMTKDYAIQPEIDHYACMVDLYGRSNQLEKAVAFMEKMPFEPDSIILSAFLNSCRANRNLELARMAERKLVEIEGDNGNGARYFQLASVYASGGKWDDMGRVMRTMRGMDVKKLAGCSWVQVGNGVHVFTSGDRSHLEAEDVYCVLGCLIDELYDKASMDENLLTMMC
ncbi:hypothetical protein DH2020_029509 [Rehmannia glutinosa]|uniref:Pentatricopeptide repeat-containing protein n=1 Tax=Rehmannia glutinosa TaxID=99300 RepID=A0ABR0VR00_REHGL